MDGLQLREQDVAIEPGKTRVAILPLANANADGDAASDGQAPGLMSAIAQILDEGGNIATVAPADALDAFPAGSPASAIDEADQQLRLRQCASHEISGELHAGGGNLRAA